MSAEVNKWDADLTRLAGIADPADRLIGVRDIILDAVTRVSHAGSFEVVADLPMLSVLRHTRASIEELRHRFPTGEATLFSRHSQQDLLKWLALLVWYDLGIINTNSVDLNVQVCLQTQRLSQEHRDELEELRVVLDSMSDWRLSHYTLRTFASILRSSTFEDQLSYQELCERIAETLQKTLDPQSGHSVLDEKYFHIAMDQLRELRTILQLRAHEQSRDTSGRGSLKADAAVHILSVGNQLGLIAFEDDRVHFWSSGQWNEAVARLEKLTAHAELSRKFDSEMVSVLRTEKSRIGYLLQDTTEPRRLNSIGFVDQVGRASPLADMLNACDDYAPSQSSVRGGDQVCISYWGRVPYSENPQYFYDDLRQTIYDGAEAILQYPHDPAKSLPPSGWPVPLLLSAYEKWYLEDLEEKHNIQLEVHCDLAATRDSFLRENSTKSTILHISTHGEAFSKTWELSNLCFASKEGSPTRVHVFDILGQNWSHLELVFLNSCLTSAGKHTSGEQPLSLAWAFLAGGAKSVIAARWVIEDRVAWQFMKHFYGRLLSDPECTVATAFQFARRKLREGSPGMLPSQWMAFVLLQTP